MKFTVNMPPVPKARARTIIRAGRVHSFTPRETEEAEWYIRQTFILEAGPYQILHMPTPIRLYVIFYTPKPKSTPKKITLPIHRPDYSNLARQWKTPLPAMPGTTTRRSSPPS
jgi:Holliday junction resolvase RusA-like endonuclease